MAVHGKGLSFLMQWVYMGSPQLPISFVRDPDKYCTMKAYA